MEHPLLFIVSAVPPYKRNPVVLSIPYATACGNFRQDVLREVLDEPATRGGKDMAYILKTPAGTFTIEPDEADWELFKLCIGGLWLASFQTAEEAACAVTKRDTGWPDWDRTHTGECPTGLAEWEEC
jgi:hypothetical protein